MTYFGMTHQLSGWIFSSRSYGGLLRFFSQGQMMILVLNLLVLIFIYIHIAISRSTFIHTLNRVSNSFLETLHSYLYRFDSSLIVLMVILGYELIFQIPECCISEGDVYIPYTNLLVCIKQIDIKKLTIIKL